ncbi:MAG: VCBS repeat-containing protein [Pirellulaceae bacterium]
MASAQAAKAMVEPAKSVEVRVSKFCGDCHRLPNPLSFNRDRWHFEVKRGYEFYAKSGRQDLDVPPLNDTLTFFRSRAPEKLEYPNSPEAPGPPPVKFTLENLTLENGIGILPEIASLKWVQLSPSERSVLLATDMRYGQVVAIDVARQDRQAPQLLAQLRNPGRVEVCDLDGDGINEILVADLASYMPSDHERSRLVMLRRTASSPSYEEVDLFSEMGRISDVRAAHLDQDGKLDLIIAEFGWRDVGRLLIAKNASTEDKLHFDLRAIDDRPGAISLSTFDFAGSKSPDILALFSQEIESLHRYRTQNDRLVPSKIWGAEDLTFGCAELTVVDLNQDGLQDILFTNGDAFDNSYLSPWHGVQWLENKGGDNFEYHRITEMPGAYAAQAGDFDRDGKLDIVVCSRLPASLLPEQIPRIASVVFLRQTEVGQFARTTLEWDAPYYPSLAVGDFDENGWLDFAVAAGPFSAEPRQSSGDSSFMKVWWNSPPAE